MYRSTQCPTAKSSSPPHFAPHLHHNLPARPGRSRGRKPQKLGPSALAPSLRWRSMARMGKAEASGRWDGSVKKMRILLGYIEFRNNDGRRHMCSLILWVYSEWECFNTSVWCSRIRCASTEFVVQKIFFNCSSQGEISQSHIRPSCWELWGLTNCFFEWSQLLKLHHLSTWMVAEPWKGLCEKWSWTWGVNTLWERSEYGGD